MKHRDCIHFYVTDATNRKELMRLRGERPYTKAVSHMAVMDITEINVLFQCVYDLLAVGGIFVFATQYPCFVTLTEQYKTAHVYQDIAIKGQPLKQYYYHRSLQDFSMLAFKVVLS